MRSCLHNAYGSVTLQPAVSRFSDEVLKGQVFTNLLEANVLVEDYRSYNNHHRPHSALGYRTPAE
jgi:putative transposase